MKAIIIGAGIGGLAAAIALRKANIDVEIYEQVSEVREVGAGLSLWANALKALDLLGLNDVIDSVTVPQIDGGIRDQHGRLLAGGSMKDLEAKYGTLVVVAHRAELQAALLKALADAPVHLNKSLARFDQDASGVTAHFEDSSVVAGDVLIGADGIRSVVRAQLHGRQPPTYSGYSGWRAVIPFDPARVLAGETWVTARVLARCQCKVIACIGLQRSMHRKEIKARLAKSTICSMCFAAGINPSKQ